MKLENYRVRREAMDAAVLAIGPHARNGFEYTTVKCDGRWVWKPTDEMPPLSAAQIKAEGGKRCLVRPIGGTAMAIGPKLVVNAPADDLQTREAMLRDLPPVTNPDFPNITATLGPISTVKMPDKVMTLKEDMPVNPPDAKAASKPSPTSLVPGTDTSKWGRDRAERRERRKDAGETSKAPVSDSHKRAKRPGEAKKTMASHPKGQSKTAMVGEMLLRPEGCTTKDILNLTGWPSCSVPAQAKAVGLKLIKRKDGKMTRYWGSK